LEYLNPIPFGIERENQMFYIGTKRVKAIKSFGDKFGYPVLGYSAQI
jgi:hypothetical protein